MGRFLTGLLAALLFPYVVTLALSGSIQGREGFFRREAGDEGLVSGDLRIYPKGQKGYVDGETCVAALVASQMPQDYEMEALKAQAIIARTYLHGKAEEAEGELLEEEALRALLNETGSIKRAREAAAETAGQVLTYDGELIRPLYHAVSAGMTRQGEFPYLKAADSSRDMEAEGYLTVLDWTPGEFAAAFRAGMKALGQEVLLTEAEIPDSIQMVEQDSGGYVRQIQIGSHVYDGESVQMALGLPSCAYTLEQVEGKVRALCRGKGHGLGLSQYGANCFAQEGKTAEEILKYYYSDIEIP